MLQQMPEMIASQLGVSELWRAVCSVVGKYVSHSYLCRVTILPVGLVLFGEIGGEGFFSASAITCAAASADLVLSVENDPDGFAASTFAEVEAGAFCSTRHSSLIRLIARSVTELLASDGFGYKAAAFDLAPKT